MLNDHPKPATLEGFLRADLPDSEMQRVFAHLMRGCPVCRAAMSPLSTGFFRPSLMEPRPESSEYDFPIARAIRTTLKRAAEGTVSAPAPAERFPTALAASFRERPPVSPVSPASAASAASPAAAG